MASSTNRRHAKVPAIVLAALLLAGACASSPETFTSVKAIRSRGKVVVGIKFEPGLGLRNPTTQRFEGFDVAIAELMAVGIFGGTRDSLGDRIEFVETSFKDRETAIDNGSVDLVVASYTINDDRKQIVDFAGPYLVTHKDLMVTSGDTSISSVTDLNGKKVCTAMGTTSADLIPQRAPQAELTLFDTFTECAEALGDGRVAAVAADETILAGLAASSGGAFKVVDARFSDEPYGIGLTKGDTELRSLLNDRLEKIEDDGEWADAFDSSLGKLGLARPTPPAIDRYVGRP